MRLLDLRGQRFGRLVVTSRSTNRAKKPRWNCVCDCGRSTVVNGADLRSANTTSCGCFRSENNPNKKHGFSKNSRAYGIWCGMRKRCLNPKDSAFANYGGRGIFICERWSDFINFLADMGEPPQKSSQIERKNNDGPYSPENCVWATPMEQAKNRRSNLKITINGETLCLSDWCGRLGLNYHAIRARIKVLGWNPNKALEVKNAQAS